MNLYLGLVVLTAFISVSVVAKDSQQEGSKNTMPMDSMMERQEPQNMQLGMQKMNLLMQQLDGENDPQKRHELIEQHMRTIHENRGMMDAPNDNSDDFETMRSMPMNERMNVMEGRMKMMQLMMAQMIEQLTQDEKK